jgi:hypothetical protein
MLFRHVKFEGPILDPFAGFGHIIGEARRDNYPARGSDIVKRSPGVMGGLDFFDPDYLAQLRRRMRDQRFRPATIIGNPPFSRFEEAVTRALELAAHSVAMIAPSYRISSGGKWLAETPLVHRFAICPRPSMLPGRLYAKLAAEGKRPGGGNQNFEWLIWRKGETCDPRAGWLYRNEEAS